METVREFKALDFNTSISIIKNSLTMLKVITANGINQELMLKVESNINKKEDFISKLTGN